MILLVFRWKIGYISVQNSPILIPRPDLERILNFLKMFNRSEPDLRTIKWSMEAAESTEGEKSSTWVKCSIRRNSYIKFLMSIYGFFLTIPWASTGQYQSSTGPRSGPKKFFSANLKSTTQSYPKMIYWNNLSI
jgi:hypothetical protein